MCSLAILQAEPKAVDLPPGVEMQPEKPGMGGEELMNHRITFLLLGYGIWIRKQQYVDQGNAGQRNQSEKEI